ncbi:hypothetical protein AFLA_005884 [Aspergillus flavus NRRL3357]|nr:hypothetical protein AFLA_005884 [Aspergillus flavus NRRL3357]
MVEVINSSTSSFPISTIVSTINAKAFSILNILIKSYPTFIKHADLLVCRHGSSVHCRRSQIERNHYD